MGKLSNSLKDNRGAHLALSHQSNSPALAKLSRNYPRQANVISRQRYQHLAPGARSCTISPIERTECTPPLPRVDVHTISEQGPPLTIASVPPPCTLRKKSARTRSDNDHRRICRSRAAHMCRRYMCREGKSEGVRQWRHWYIILCACSARIYEYVRRDACLWDYGDVLIRGLCHGEGNILCAHDGL